MKKSKFTEEQIAFALKQAETGTTVEEICRKLGIGQASGRALLRRCSSGLCRRQAKPVGVVLPASGH